MAIFANGFHFFHRLATHTTLPESRSRLSVKIAITVQDSFKKLHMRAQLIKICVSARTNTLALLVFELSAHDQWNQWADNLKN